MIHITQENLEILNKPPNTLKLTQENLEVINLPPNNLQMSQMCVEVIIKFKNQTYTDSAANCNFAH